MTQKVIGHLAQRESLHRLLGAGKLATTLMLAGTPGVGKRLIAREIAQALLCETPRFERASHARYACTECKRCKLITLGNCPDLFHVACLDRETWNLAAVRDLLYSLNLTSYSGTARVALFNDAEAMSDQIANVLLKSLEEPRPGMYFILVSANPSKLPATLLSRCQVWSFSRLTDGELKEIVRSNAALRSDALSDDELVALADGSLHNISELTTHAAAWRTLNEDLNRIVQGDLTRALELSSRMAKERESLRATITLLRISARHHLHQAAKEGKSKEAIQRWSAALTNFIEAERLIFDRNINAAYVLQFLMMRLSQDDALAAFTGLTYNATLLQNIVE